MINHTRTYLLNQPSLGEGWSSTYGEYYVPETFQPVKLPGYLQILRRYLFGSDPDRDMLNYRLQQFMTLLHATPLADWVLQPDGRVTYVYENVNWADPYVYSPRVFTDKDVSDYQITGEPSAPDAGGRMRHDYDLKLIEGSLELQYLQDESYNQAVDLVTHADSFCDAVPLPGSGYLFQVREIPDGSFQVHVRNRPQWDLGQLVPLLEVDQSPLLTLFGDETAEPWPTLRNLWYCSEEFPLRLGAVLLAIARRTGEVASG